MLQQKAKNKSCLPSLPEQKKQKKKSHTKIYTWYKTSNSRKKLDIRRGSDHWPVGTGSEALPLGNIPGDTKNNPPEIMTLHPRKKRLSYSWNPKQETRTKFREGNDSALVSHCPPQKNEQQSITPHIVESGVLLISTPYKAFWGLLYKHRAPQWRLEMTHHMQRISIKSW